MTETTTAPGVPTIPQIPPINPIGAVGPITTISSVSGPGKSKSKLSSVTVGSYWIDKYTRCHQKNLDYCKAVAGGFAGAMRSRGNKVGVIRGDADASPKQWSAATDQDANGVDTIEFAFIATHGGTRGTEVPEKDGRPRHWLYWFTATFDSPDGCRVSTIQLNNKLHPPDSSKPVTTMRLGEGSLRWAVLDTCRSMPVRVENERDQGARFQLANATPASVWARCFDGVNMLFGFTGLSSDGSWTSDRGARFGHHVGSGEKLADTWVDEAHSYWEDDAPVALACGRSEKDATQRLHGESLKAVAQSLRPAEIKSFAWMWRV